MLNQLYLTSPPKMSREDFRALTLVPVIGDQMSPTLRGGWDYVLALPCKAYQGEGLYVVADEIDQPLIWQCQFNPVSGGIDMRCDNPAYRGDTVDREWFDSNVVGIVVSDLKVRRHDLIAERREAA